MRKVTLVVGRKDQHQHGTKMEFKPHHYRPLIDCLTIRESEIEGLGLHALVDIQAGVYLGETHIFEQSRHEWIRTPLGGFINHSDEPNCFLNINNSHHQGEQKELYAVRPIMSGEELTLFYTTSHYNDAK